MVLEILGNLQISNRHLDLGKFALINGDFKSVIEGSPNNL